jgi:nitrogen-specific signal transduction histidine kinase
MCADWAGVRAPWWSAATLQNEMNSAAIPALIALVIQFGLGLTVFQANSKRRSNQCFLLLSLAICGWLATLYFGLNTRDSAVAGFWMRQASAAGAVVLPLFNLLRLSIRNPKQSWRGIFRDSWIWLLAAFTMAVFCQTRLFLQGARLSQAVEAIAPHPLPVYGHGVALYVAYFIGAGIALIITYARDVRRTSGARRTELEFFLIGAAVILATVLVFFTLGLFGDRSRLVWFAPFRIVLFSLVIAYGISTRKIMDVGVFLRRAMSYGVLTAYLLALYGLVWWLVARVTTSLFHSSDHTFAHVAAALVVTFAMAPARGFSQSLADRLFVGNRRLDFRTMVSKAAAILESVTTLPDLLRRFATTIGEAVGTDSVTIYLAQRKGFRKSYPASSSTKAVDEFAEDNPLVQWLATQHEPLVLEELHRVRGTATTFAVRGQLEQAGAAAAVGILSREHLVGIMLLGPRLSGRIYGGTEQSALQVLCGQLAVAIENAELFTEVQNARIYNEILLQNLTTGVVAADADGHITVFNQEVAQIAGLNTNGGERTVNDLPAPLRDIIQTTLTSGERQEDREVELCGGTGSTFARASSATFRGQGGELLGALMVVTDITALKRLELQIRRSDRLASLGTLSAGMAHEIKNPLVSIKTFAQLLPERYHESDFRETFSGLIVHEIDRLDSLVNQLLRFARPAKPLLRPMHVHEVLEKTFRLVQHRLYRKEIKLTRTFEASLDTVRADSDQMEQVFLNFFLNAMDAMKRGGELTVGTEIRTGDSLVTHLLPEDEERHEALCISIRDTGEGIKKEDIVRVFDPFFTTKDFGTGLGLSVVHGIIEEHGGRIEVESEVAKGTAFHIFLPLVHFDQKVVAA